MWDRLGTRGLSLAVRLGALGLSVGACERPDGTRDWGPLYAVATLVALFLIVRWIVRWGMRLDAARDELLRTGVQAKATLVSHEVVASSPRGKLPTTSVRLWVELAGGSAERAVDGWLPTHQLAALKPGLVIWLRHPEGRLDEAIVDWAKTLR